MVGCNEVVDVGSRLTLVMVVGIEVVGRSGCRRCDCGDRGSSCSGRVGCRWGGGRFCLVLMSS